MISIKEYIKENSDEHRKTISLRDSLEKHCMCFSIRGGESLSVRQILLDNYYILVIGDSVVWGQGLNEDEKFYSLVEKFIQSRTSQLRKYTKMS